MITTHNIYIDELDIEIEFTVESYVCNDGIGSYEFWGSYEYDSGENYTEIDTIEYDNTKFTDQENGIIADYIKRNNKDIRRNILIEIENLYK